eukprot:1514138-Rhodomonas_salina.1
MSPRIQRLRRLHVHVGAIGVFFKLIRAPLVWGLIGQRLRIQPPCGRNCTSSWVVDPLARVSATLPSSIMKLNYPAAGVVTGNFTGNPGRPPGRRRLGPDSVPRAASRGLGPRTWARFLQLGRPAPDSEFYHFKLARSVVASLPQAAQVWSSSV